METGILSDPPPGFTVEHSLSTELLKLSFKERQAIQEEIHGVSCEAIEESRELVEKSLLDFDEKINTRKELAVARPELDDPNLRKLLRNVCRINSLSRDALKAAKRRCYLNDRNVRLRFLRCEIFNVDKTVERFIRFLEYCSEIFGDYICEREMVLSDFNSQEITTLRASRSQLLPFRDRSGRRVLAAVGNVNFHMSLKLRLKIRMFQHWHSSADIETQRRGVVILLWPFDEEGGGQTWEKTIRPGIAKDNSTYQRKNNAAMPIRVASYHFCYKDTPFFHALSAMYVYHVLTPERRAIYNAHFGDHTELLYKCGSYGIPTDLLPVSFTGSIKFGHMNAWINYQRAHEEQIKHGGERDKEWVECPWPNDVIFRKGSTFRNNQGNIIYRAIVAMYSEEHIRSDKKKKFEITHTIMNEIEKRNGRFLEWSVEKLLWVVIDDRDRVRKKIAAAFKQHVRRKRLQLGGSDALKGETNSNSTKALGGTSFKQARNREGQSLKDYYSIQHYSEQRADDCCFGKPLHSSS